MATPTTSSAGPTPLDDRCPPLHPVERQHWASRTWTKCTISPDPPPLALPSRTSEAAVKKRPATALDDRGNSASASTSASANASTNDSTNDCFVGNPQAMDEYWRFVRSVPFDVRLEMCCLMTKPMLKALLKHKGRPIYGRKVDLVDRIAYASPVIS